MQALKTASQLSSQPKEKLLNSAHAVSADHAALVLQAQSSQDMQAAQSQREASILSSTRQQQQQQQQLNVGIASVAGHADASWQSPQQSVRSNILGLDQLSAMKQGRPVGQPQDSPCLEASVSQVAFDAESVSTDMDAGSVSESIEVSVKVG